MTLATPTDMNASPQVRSVIELRLIGDDGTRPGTAKAMGEVQIRGPWVATEYYKDEHPGEQWHDGWLKTGDVGVIDSEGYLQLVDRAKDLLKSGGDWISSWTSRGRSWATPRSSRPR